MSAASDEAEPATPPRDALAPSPSPPPPLSPPLPPFVGACFLFRAPHATSDVVGVVIPGRRRRHRAPFAGARRPSLARAHRIACVAAPTVVVIVGVVE
jgi:hypothetical protein